MFQVCRNCGLWHRDQVIDPAGPAAICPECGQRHLIAAQQGFNRWFREEGAFGQPPIALLDTTYSSPDETAMHVAAWIRGRLVEPPGV